jgi:hypothetical protein
MSEKKKGITEYRAEPVTPKLAFEGEDEVFDAAVEAQCTDSEEIALHVTRQNKGDGPISSVYLTPAAAWLLAERIRTSAWIAERI